MGLVMSAIADQQQTLFSTDIVKYQYQSQNPANYENGSFSNLALKRWLQVTIPLTALTLFGAWSAYRFYSVSARDDTFFERSKRAVLSTTPSAAGSSVQAPPDDGPNTHNVTNKGPFKRLSASISRLTSSIQPFGKSGAVLPRYGGSPAKSG
jgi:hypothetical protein